MREHLSEGDVLYHDFDSYRPNGEKIIYRINATRHLKQPVFEDLMLNGNALPNFTVVARREMIKQVGGVSEEKVLISVEDFDLWLKLSRKTDKFVYIPMKLGAAQLCNEDSISEFWTENNLIRMRTLYEKHMPKLDVEKRIQAEILLDYYCARFKLTTGQFDEALPLLIKSIIGSKNSSVRAKSLYFSLVLHFKRLRKAFA